MDKKAIVLAKTVQQLKEGLAAGPKRGRAHRYMTVKGGCQLALARNIGHSSALAATVATGSHITPKYVYSWELKACAALIAKVRTFHNSHEADLSWRDCVVHRFRGDATNSGMLQKQKIII